MLGKCCTAELHPEPQIPNILKNHILISYLCVYVCMYVPLNVCGGQRTTL